MRPQVAPWGRHGTGTAGGVAVLGGCTHHSAGNYEATQRGLYLGLYLSPREPPASGLALRPAALRRSARNKGGAPLRRPTPLGSAQWPCVKPI